jgi:hypothetical protein
MTGKLQTFRLTSEVPVGWNARGHKLDTSTPNTAIRPSTFLIGTRTAELLDDLCEVVDQALEVVAPFRRNTPPCENVETLQYLV